MRTPCKLHICQSQTPCLCTLQPLKAGHLTIKDTFFCPKSVLIREVPPYLSRVRGCYTHTLSCYDGLITRNDSSVTEHQALIYALHMHNISSISIGGRSAYRQLTSGMRDMHLLQITNKQGVKYLRIVNGSIQY